MVTSSSSTTVHTSLPIKSTYQETFTKPDFSLLSAVLEGFADGLLILALDGTCLHRNQKGKALCHTLNQSSNQEVPDCLWAMCNYLLEGRDLFPEHSFVLTQDFTCAENRCIRARAQWLDWPHSADSYFLVLLEDQTLTAQNSALLEALQYDLTPRERDVWLLKRANRSYEAIALELYITVNTVKRHLKSIYAKRKQVLEEMVN
ncbi:MAG: LuxR family transcriptional regulator [Leptolyngbyaceae cyanobacterium SM2_5_2]|nr:LuxR family transcriptional regulator [Leptolyngbyaceae cyanobacterium SM2_5_2]